MSGDTHLTHIDEKGDVRMVDVSQKPDTERVAIAEGFISMHPETLALIVEGKAAKGDVLACARVAGVMAAKQTSTLIRGRARRRPRGHSCHHDDGRHRQDRHRDGGPHGGERRVPYRVRHVQGGRPRDGNL